MTIPKDILAKAIEFQGRADDAGLLARALVSLSRTRSETRLTVEIEIAVRQAIIHWNRAHIGPGRPIPPLDIDKHEEGDLAVAVLVALKNAAPQAGEGPYSSSNAGVHPEKPAVAAPSPLSAVECTYPKCGYTLPDANGRVGVLCRPNCLRPSLAEIDPDQKFDQPSERHAAGAKLLEELRTPSPVAHTDHPARHFDRTCPACIAEGTPAVEGRVEQLIETLYTFPWPHNKLREEVVALLRTAPTARGKT